MSYILSNANRWYCARENAYGQVSAIDSTNRIPAVGMKVQNQRDKNQRKDKTGTRTWQGLPVGMRRHTTVDATSYMRDWPDPTTLPPHGPLIEAAMGGQGAIWPGATVSDGTTQSSIYFVSPHGLTPGQAVVSNGEIRFVAAVVTPLVVVVNAPFTVAPVTGVPLSATANYTLATQLPSVSLFDYWDPADAVQRIIPGVGVDRMTVSMNGDFHQFEFSGMAQDLLDSASFQAGQGGMSAFPLEPTPAPIDYALVPGNLGEVWMGVIANQMFTVTQASVEIKNNVAMRENEYGAILPLAIAAGAREVTVTLEFFSQDDVPTAALYQAARQQSPVGVMFQLGQVAGQMVGVYLKSLIPDVPEFDDGETRLKWRFRNTRAQGTQDDEMVVAFG
jgi:hypothetical protein